MAAIVINGNAIAAAVRWIWKGRVEALKRRGVLPALAVVIVGDNLASKIYVRNKVKACGEVGLHSEVHELPTDIGEDMVLAHIRRLNQNPSQRHLKFFVPSPWKREGLVRLSLSDWNDASRSAQPPRPSPARGRVREYSGTHSLLILHMNVDLFEWFCSTLEPQVSNIHGILVQLPLPPQINRDKVLATVSADKDVDGFHVHNLGALVTGNALFPPCTPYGIQYLLDHLQIPIEGQNAVVVGRSTIVGKPMA